MQALRSLDPLDPLQSAEKATSKGRKTRLMLLAAPGSLRIGPGVLVAKRCLQHPARRENYHNHSSPEPWINDTQAHIELMSMDYRQGRDDKSWSPS